MNLNSTNDIIGTVFDNCIASVIEKLFVYLCANDYEAGDELEIHHISVLKKSYRIINKRGWFDS